MDATVTEIREARRQIIEHEQAIKRLNDKIDEMLGLSSGRRKPIRKSLSPSQAGALFAELEETAREHCKAQ